MSHQLQVPEGVAPDAWARLARKGRNERGTPCWEIDERDAQGVVIGTAYRFARVINGSNKGFRKGGTRGLTVAWPLAPYAGSSAADPVLVVEGATDTATLIGLGFDAVGVPCAGASSASAPMLAELVAGRHVVLLADRDGGAGASGTIRLAGILLEWCESVRIIPAPKDAKDSRAAVIAGATRADFLALIEEAVPLEPEPVDGDPIIRRLDQVKAEAVDWLWPGRIARGKLNLIAGDPGLGKSFLTLDVAARVSTGAGWPDRPNERREPGGVVLLSAEDGTADTVVPRLIAAGADRSRIAVLEGVHDRSAPRAFNFERDIEALGRAVRAVPGCVLVEIDPVSAYLGGVDSHKNADVRGLLAPLAALAAELGVAVVMVTHLNKSAGAPALYRTMGSLAFAAAARSAWAVAKDRSDPGRRLLLPMKNNLAADTGGLAFRLVAAEAGSTPVVQWEAEPVDSTAEEALAYEAPGERRSCVERAVDWLKDVLGSGPVPAQAVIAAAEAAGISGKTLDRAKGALGVVSRKTAVRGGWNWHLQECQSQGFGALGVEPEEVAENAPKDAKLGGMTPLGGDLGTLGEPGGSGGGEDG